MFNVFLQLDAPSAIVFQHVSQPHFALTGSMARHEKGTSLTWAQAFEDRAVAARIKSIVVPANEQNLDRLEAVLSKSMPVT